MKIVKSAIDALVEVKSSQRVFVHGAAATPRVLLQGLCDRASTLEDVELCHLHTMGPAFWADEKYRKSFRLSSFFVGSNLRGKLEHGRIDYLPCFLSEIPQIIRSGRLPIDVALVHLSPPDQHGYCTLGTSVDIAGAAVERAKVVIAQINRQMPRVHGDGFVHIDKINYAVEIDEPLPEELHKPIGEVERAIAKNVASLVEDGSTLQMGIGTIPDAVLSEIGDRKHLGIHSEMWTDGALKLIQSGAVDNSRKKNHPGKTVSGFVVGSRAVYDFIHDNPSVVQLDMSYVNNPTNIARNPKVVAINSAVEIDLTGQVCADSIGPSIISGAGGQMDFIRGASLSPGGKPIIALPSRTLARSGKSAKSRIVPVLKEGAGVVTTRAHVHYVITEYGIADLYGKSIDHRARELINIAHPEERENLEKLWRALK